MSYRREDEVTVSIAALWLGFSPETIRRWCDKGSLEGAKQYGGKGGEWRIPYATLATMRAPPEWLLPDLNE